MSQRYDVIVIGGGHNGLVAAASLASAGKRVLVLEQRDVLGGAAATEEIFPGHKVNTGAGEVSLFLDEIVDDLYLKMHGLEFRHGQASLFCPQLNGRPLTIWRDDEKTAGEISHFSERDAQRYVAFKATVERMAGAFRAMMTRLPPELSRRSTGDLFTWGRVALKVRQMGRREMMEFLRVIPMPVKTFLDEWFESPLLKGVLGAEGIIGLRQGPRAAGTALMFLYRQTGGFLSNRVVFGGTGQLSEALAQAARASGAEIRLGAKVTRITVEAADPFQASGIALAGGEEIRAGVVLSNADPRNTLFGLVGPQLLDPGFMRQVRNVRYKGSTAKINLALSALPEFTGQVDTAQLEGAVRISPDLDYLERAFDAAKYAEISRRPFLDVRFPTLLDSTLAPAGRHLMTVTMQYAPYDLRQGDWDEGRETLGDLVLDVLGEYAPGLGKLVTDRQVITPLDWERDYGLTEGSIHHGQMALDQLMVMRPVPGWGRYATPIQNLYLCGAGAHPGGGVTGAPGYLAAKEVLRHI